MALSLQRALLFHNAREFQCLWQFYTRRILEFETGFDLTDREESWLLVNFLLTDGSQFRDVMGVMGS